MVDRVRAAYEKMIAVEQNAGGGGSSSGSGFNARYAFFGIKDLMEGRTKFAIAEAANELMRLQGTALAIGGTVAGVAALGIAAYEVAKKLREIREEPERIAAEFARLTGATKTANDELRVANDRLENSIAKLEHRPQNNLKLAIDEAAVAADHLSEKMDKVLRSFAEVAIKNAPGMFASILGQSGIDDIVKLIQGKSGYGGLIGDLYKATSSGGDPTKVLEQYRAQVVTMIRQSEMAEAYQQGKGYEGVSYEDIRDAMMGPMTGRGKLPPGLHFENMLADQGTRLETLRALKREIDLLGESYSLEKQNTGLTAQEDRIKEITKSTSVTEELRQQVARAQEGELNGLARINAAYEERLRHLKEEGELNTVNAKLAREIRDAEIARFEKEEQQMTAAAVFGANTSLAEAGIRSNYAIFQANRKANGAAFGEADIKAEYDTAMALAQKQFDLAAQHVRELREMDATEGEIQRAQIEATKNFALAALDAETKETGRVDRPRQTAAGRGVEDRPRQLRQRPQARRRRCRRAATPRAERDATAYQDGRVAWSG